MGSLFLKMLYIVGTSWVKIDVFNEPLNTVDERFLKLANTALCAFYFFYFFQHRLVVQTCMHLQNVPDGFIKQHIRESKGTATLRYSDRSWLVKLLKCKNRLASFSAGWSAFARETRLCIGNACVFELIDRDDVVFKVSIFSNGGKGQIHLD